MFYSIFPEKDATLYEVSSSQNTGLDEILELQNTQVLYGGIGVAFNSRILLKFDITAISKSMAGNTPEIPSAAKFYLRLYTTKAEELPLSYSVETYPVSQSWEMGTGRYYNFPKTTEGTSWKFRDGQLASNQWATESFAAGSTGGSQTENGGGTWWTVSGSAQQEFNYSETDVHMDVTTIVKNWITGSISAGGGIPNEGFMVKRVSID